MQTVQDLPLEGYDFLKRSIFEAQLMDQNGQNQEKYALNMTEMKWWTKVTVILVLKYGKTIGYLQNIKSNQLNFTSIMPATDKQIPLSSISQIICKQDQFIIKFKKEEAEHDWKFRCFKKNNLNYRFARIIFEEVQKLSGINKLDLNCRFTDKKKIKTTQMEYMKTKKLQNLSTHLRYRKEIILSENPFKTKSNIAVIGEKQSFGGQALVTLKQGDSISYSNDFSQIQLKLDHKIISFKKSIKLEDITKIVLTDDDQLFIHFEDESKSNYWSFQFLFNEQLAQKWQKILRKEIISKGQKYKNKQKESNINQNLFSQTMIQIKEHLRDKYQMSESYKQNSNNNILYRQQQSLQNRNKQLQKSILTIQQQLKQSQTEKFKLKKQYVKSLEEAQQQINQLKQKLLLQENNIKQSQQFLLNKLNEQSNKKEVNLTQKIIHFQNQFKILNLQNQKSKQLYKNTLKQFNKYKVDNLLKNQNRKQNVQSQKTIGQFAKSTEKLEQINLKLTEENKVQSEKIKALEKQLVKSMLEIEKLEKVRPENLSNDIIGNKNARQAEKIERLQKNRKQLIQEIEELKMELKESEEQKMKMEMKISALLNERK